MEASLVVGVGRVARWIRPFVPEASDGILTSAGICEGFAGAGVSSSVLIFAGFAGLVAGTLAMGAVEYSKLRAERDQQVAQLTAERVQLETAPDAELDELTEHYVVPRPRQAGRRRADRSRCAGGPCRGGIRHHGRLPHRCA